MDLNSKKFINSIITKDILGIKETPKADLHNHFVMGGNREYIRNITGIEIPSIEGVLSSMQEMDKWNNKYIGKKFDRRERRRILIEATFYQAKVDGVTILEIGEDVWGLGEYFSNNIEVLLNAFNNAHKSIAPEIELRLQIGLSRHCNISYLEECLEHFWGRKEFYSIDLYGDELAQPIEKFHPIYRRAKEYGLKLKAHIGEWGTAEDIRKGVDILGLDEIQHGIAASTSQEVMKYLIDNHIRLNIVPTSNVKLGRVSNLSRHPIKTLPGKSFHKLHILCSRLCQQ